MYSQEKIQKRQELAKDPDIIREIDQIIKMYVLTEGKITETEYKRMQARMAIALRPDIDEQELQFVIDEDWKLDQKEGAILPEEMRNKIF